MKQIPRPRAQRQKFLLLRLLRGRTVPALAKGPRRSDHPLSAVVAERRTAVVGFVLVSAAASAGETGAAVTVDAIRLQVVVFIWCETFVVGGRIVGVEVAGMLVR